MKKIFAASVIMGILSVLLSFCARKVTGFAQAYSVTVYPVLKGIFARISGIFPFSVSEAGLYFLLCFILFCLIRWFKKPLFLLNGACFIAALLFFLFTVNCGINYYRNSFSYEAGFVVRSHSIDELYALCSDLVDNVNENVPQETDTPPSDAGNLSYFQNFPYLQKMGKEGQKAMKGLADQYPQFKSWDPYPQPFINPKLLSVWEKYREPVRKGLSGCGIRQWHFPMRRPIYGCRLAPGPECGSGLWNIVVRLSLFVQIGCESLVKQSTVTQSAVYYTNRFYGCFDGYLHVG